jgi:hypothetical protein
VRCVRWDRRVTPQSEADVPLWACTQVTNAVCSDDDEVWHSPPRGDQPVGEVLKHVDVRGLAMARSFCTMTPQLAGKMGRHPMAVAGPKIPMRLMHSDSIAATMEIVVCAE